MQALPQPPQFMGSVCTSLHPVVGQLVCPARQGETHWPSTHTSSARQAGSQVMGTSLGCRTSSSSLSGASPASATPEPLAPPVPPGTVPPVPGRPPPAPPRPASIRSGVMGGPGGGARSVSRQAFAVSPSRTASRRALRDVQRAPAGRTLRVDSVVTSSPPSLHTGSISTRAHVLAQTHLGPGAHAAALAGTAADGHAAGGVGPRVLVAVEGGARIHVRAKLEVLGYLRHQAAPLGVARLVHHRRDVGEHLLAAL